jgi:threonine synthase
MFNNLAFRDRVKLSGVNSINWGRIVAQIVYFFKAAAQLGAPHRSVSFTVPTGNFGDIFAGYAAKRMGLPIERLVIATNSNDILRRTLETGRYDVGGVAQTFSPSMDIQVSSNFERLLFEALDRDGTSTARLLASLSQSGGFALPERALATIRRDFAAGTADEAQTLQAIAGTFAAAHYLVDPHTAVGLSVAEHFREAGTPMVTLATAHPAKFPDAVLQAAGVSPGLPAFLADLFERPERVHVLANDPAAVENFILARTRA